jgi:hypothetical protein
LITLEWMDEFDVDHDAQLNWFEFCNVVGVLLRDLKMAKANGTDDDPVFLTASMQDMSLLQRIN